MIPKIIASFRKVQFTPGVYEPNPNKKSTANYTCTDNDHVSVWKEMKQASEKLRNQMSH